MTPEEFKTTRNNLGLSCRQMARALGLKGLWDDRTIRRWEAGTHTIKPWVAVKLAKIVKDRALDKYLPTEEGEE